jgi:hypothetical protein
MLLYFYYDIMYGLFVFIINDSIMSYTVAYTFVLRGGDQLQTNYYGRKIPEPK